MFCYVNIVSFHCHIQGSPLMKKETFNLVKYSRQKWFILTDFWCFWWRVEAVNIHSPQIMMQLALWVLHIIFYQLIVEHCGGHSWVRSRCRELVKMLQVACLVAVSDQPKFLHAQVLISGSLAELFGNYYGWVLYTQAISWEKQKLHVYLLCTWAIMKQAEKFELLLHFAFYEQPGFSTLCTIGAHTPTAPPVHSYTETLNHCYELHEFEVYIVCCAVNP